MYPLSLGQTNAKRASTTATLPLIYYHVTNARDRITTDTILRALVRLYFISKQIREIYSRVGASYPRYRKFSSLIYRINIGLFLSELSNCGYQLCLDVPLWTWSVYQAMNYLEVIFFLWSLSWWEMNLCLVYTIFIILFNFVKNILNNCKKKISSLNLLVILKLNLT